jgi:predicted ATPase/class 3 adenylate cyclase
MEGMADLPTGTVTFVFTDIEGSTRLLERLGDRYGEALEEHRVLIRTAAERAGGRVVDAQGDATFLVFRSPDEAVSAAVDIQQRLAEGAFPVSVRIGIHTGEGFVRGSGYVGLDVHRAARVMAAAHGGQILVSGTAADLVREGLIPGTSLRSLGEHLLRDLARPEHLFQLEVEGLPNSFPPPRTEENRASNLPEQLTSFVGRDRELEAVRQALAGTRLLTLIGPGGTGKTRLALELAATVGNSFPGGARFVPLAALREPAEVPAAIAEVFHLPEGPGDRRAPMERVVEHLRPRELLLVLDNFEQVLGAATAVAELLREAPRVTIVVTSRAALQVSGERQYPVPTLRLPSAEEVSDLDALARSEAVTLFLDRAIAVRPDLALTADNAATVAEICARLDGLPLALELAAAQLRIFNPDELLARLSDRFEILAHGPRDLPARQRALRDTIAWSHDLLSSSDRRLFARLSVFSDGGRLEEIESVCEPLGSERAVRALTSLVDQSLVSVVGGPSGSRFGMLETIREFADDRLRSAGEREDVRLRHATTFLQLAETAAPELTLRQGRRWLDRLEPEHANLRAALEWSIAGSHADLALRFVASLWRFWQISGRLNEGQSWADRALALPGGEARSRAAALIGAGGIAYWRFEPTDVLYEAALAEAERSDDELLRAEALYNAAWSTSDRTLRGEMPHKRRARLERSLETFERLGSRRGMAQALWGLGDFDFLDKRFEEGRTRVQRSLTLAREEGDVFLEAWAQYLLGAMARDDGDVREAGSRLRTALRLFAEARDVSGMIVLLDAVAGVILHEGDAETAIKLSAAADQLRGRTGTNIYDQTQTVGSRDYGAGRSEEAVAGAISEGMALTIDQAVELALGSTERVSSSDQRGGGVPTSRPGS